MAVYRIKRKTPPPLPADNTPETERDSLPVGSASDQPAQTERPADRNKGGAGISRSKKRALDAYVGSGKSARKMKENGGSMVDAIYNRREKATESTNEADRMLLEAFSDDKTLKKELKRQEKLRKKEEKRLKKLEKRGVAVRVDTDDFLVSGDDYANSLDSLDSEFSTDPFEMLYSSDELKTVERTPKGSGSPADPGPLAGNPDTETAAESSPDAKNSDPAFLESVFASLIPGNHDEEQPEGSESKENAQTSGEPEPFEIGENAEETAKTELTKETKEQTEESEAVTEEETRSAAPAPSTEEKVEAEDGDILADADAESGEKPAEAEAQSADAESGEKFAEAEAEGSGFFEDAETESGAQVSAEPSEADSDMAATREFRFTGMDTDEIRKILEQEGLAAAGAGENAPEFAEASRADLYDDSEQDFADDLLRAAKRTKQPEEFTDPDLAEEMTESIKNRSVRTLACAVWSFLVMAVALYLDSACFTRLPHPAFLSTGRYGAVLILFDLQMLLISGLLLGSNFISGFKSLFAGKANSDSVTAVAMTVAALYEISLLFTSASDPGIMLFSSAGCLFGFLSAVSRYLDERRLYRSFRVVASKKPKFVAKRLGTDSSEFEALREHLPEEPDIFTVEKTKFVSGFMAASRKPSKSTGAYNAAVWIVLILAAIFGVYNLSGGAASAFKGFALVCLFGLPACGVFALSVPIGKMSRKCAADESAILGAGAVDEYAGASVISFNDTELFPASKIRVTSIRTYGDTRIDRGILYAAMIFSKVGGPLSKVFAKSISSVYPEIPSDFDVLENTGDGICAKIDGKEIFVGNKDYMLSYDFGYVNEDIDEAFENSVGRIMYMAVQDRIAAKFYIRYAFNPRFERVMRALYRAGTCVSVKTCDPNIDDELIRSMMRNRSYPVGVLKTSGASLETPVSESAESGLVCSSSILNMLRAFICCAKAKKLISVNILVKFISLFVGVFAAAVLCLFGRMNSITSLFVMIYQLLWVLAVIIPSASD